MTLIPLTNLSRHLHSSLLVHLKSMLTMKMLLFHLLICLITVVKANMFTFKLNSKYARLAEHLSTVNMNISTSLKVSMMMMNKVNGRMKKMNKTMQQNQRMMKKKWILNFLI